MTRTTAVATIAVGIPVSIIAGVAFAYLPSSEHVIAATMALCVIAVALFPTALRIGQGKFDIFEPTFGAGIILALIFGIKPLYLVAENDVDYYGHSIDAQIVPAVALALLGALAFVCAYLVPWHRKVSETPPPAETLTGQHSRATSRALTLAIAAGLLGILLFAIHLARTGSFAYGLSLWLGGRSDAYIDASSGTSEYLSAGPILAACGAIAVCAVSRGRLTAYQLLVVCALVSIPTTAFLVGGDRRFLIPSIVIPIVIYYLARRKQPSRRVLLVLVPLSFVVLATIPYARASGARDQAGGLAPIFADAFAAPLTAWNNFITSYDTDMLGALSVQLQVQTNPDDFFYGRATIGDLLIAPIPSALFHDKPITARDEMLIRTFGAPCTLTAGGLCPDFSVIGTFYQDLWWLGVVIGMTSLGLLSRWSWQRLGQNPTSPSRLVVAATWIVALPILIRAGFMPSFAWWLYFLFPSLLLVVTASAGRSVRARVVVRPGSQAGAGAAHVNDGATNVSRGSVGAGH